MTRVLKLLPVLLAGFASAACGESEDLCFDDRACGTGLRCEGVTFNGAGVCVACGDTEVPYDGIDNDCSVRTPDADLDGDGQNAVNASVNPGMDCDDSDSTIFAGAPEMCGDGVNSDCDEFGGPGASDDPDCGDNRAPTVQILSPAPGTRVSGIVTFSLRLEDDTGVVSVAITSGGLQLEAQSFPAVSSGDVEVDLDTNRLPDGDRSLSFEVRDRASRTDSTVLRLRIDNTFPPEISLLSPLPGRSFNGTLRLAAEATDPDGVDLASATVTVDGNPVTATSTGSLAFFVETAGLSEGLHSVGLTLSDALGNTGTATTGFTVDRTGPVVTAAVTPNMPPFAGTVQVSLTAEDPAGVIELRAQGRTGTNVLTFDLDTTQLPNGTFTLTATAVDGALDASGVRQGNQGVGNFPIQIDNIDTRPQVAFLQPAANDTVVGPTFVEMTVMQGDSGNRLELFLDGATVARLTRAPWEVTLNLLDRAGPRRLEAVVTDSTGQTGRASLDLQQVPGPTLRLASASRESLSALEHLELVDIDGDGILDIVASGAQVFLHTGSVTGGRYRWSSPQVLANVRVGRFKIVDIDDDGDLDLLGTDGRQLVWLLNTMGTLGSARTLVLADTNLSRLDAADIDSDGDLDVVVAGGSAAAGYVYTLDAAQNYGLAQTLGGDGGVSEVRFARADGDSFIDIVVGRSRRTTVSVFRSNGAGLFGAGIDTQVIGNAEAFAIGDVSRDGFPDLVVGTTVGPQVLLGNAATPGAFGPGVSAPGSAEDGIELADMNGDGVPEILALDDNVQSVQVWSFAAGQLTTGSTVLVGGTPLALSVGDLDNDTVPDVIVRLGRTFLRVDTRAGGEAQAPQVVRLLNAMPAIAIGQVSGSTQADVVVSDAVEPVVRVLEGDGQLGLTESFVGMLPTGLRSADAIDIAQIDGQGGLDFATANRSAQAANSRSVYLSGGGGSFTRSDFAGTPAEGVVVADFDQDGAAELAFVVPSTMNAMNGVELVSAAGLPEASLRFGQLALNGVVGVFSPASTVPELAVANGGSENITVHRWDGMRYRSTTYNAPTGLGRINVGRIGTDALDDIVGVAGRIVFFLEADPVLGFRPPVTLPVAQTVVEVVSIDVNQDGLRDLVAVGSRVLYVILARGGRQFFEPIPFDYANGAERLLVADMDGDGREDLVTSHPALRSVITVPADGDRF